MIDFADQIVPGLLRATAALSIAAVLVALCVRCLRIRSPGAERIAWLLVLLQGVVLVQVFIPLPSGLVEPPPSDETSARPQRAAPNAGEMVPVAVHRAPAVPELATRTSTVPVGSPAALPAATAEKSWSFPELSWTTSFLCVWGAGFVAILVGGTVLYWRFVRRLRQAVAAPTDWEAEWREMLKKTGVSARIRLVISRDIGPALCRLPRESLVVVPKRHWTELDASERKAILRHELEHLRRGDLWWALLARLLATIHWFNPCAWWAAARFEEQGEFACDRAAAGEEPAQFGELLLRLGSGSKFRSLGVQTMATGNLYQRIRRLAGSSQNSPRWRSGVPLVIALLVMVGATVRFATLPARVFADEQSGETAEEPLPERALVRLGTNVFATRGFVLDLAFSPDGKRIAIAEANTPTGTVRIYDVKTAKQVVKLVSQVENSGYYQCLAYAPDGERIVCGTYGGRISLWNVAARKEVFSEELYEGEVNDLAWSPDGEAFATVGSDGGVYIRSASEPGRVISELIPGDVKPKPNADAFAAAGRVGTGPRPISADFTPDGTKLIVGYDSGKVAVWDPRTNELLHSFDSLPDDEDPRSSLLNDKLYSLEVLPDGKNVMTAGYRHVKRKTTPLTYGAKNVRVPEVHLWDLESGEKIADFGTADEYGWGFSDVSPDGKRVVIALYGQVVVRGVEEQRTLLRIPIEGLWTDQPTFSPDGRLIAMPRNGSFVLFDAKTGERLYDDPAASTGTVLDADWSWSGDRIVTGSQDGRVRVWNSQTGKLIWHRQLAPVFAPTGEAPTPSFVAYSPDGATIIAAGERDDRQRGWEIGTMVVYDATNGETLREVEIPRTVRGGALSHDGRVAVLATSYGSLGDTRLFAVEVATGEILYRTPPNEKEHGLWSVEAIAFLPDSSAFRVATGDSKIIRFEAATGERQETLNIDWRTAEQKSAEKPKSEQLWEAVFSPDAAILISSSSNIVSRWNAATGKRLLRMPHPHEKGCRLGISSDGEIFATSDLLYVGDYGRNIIRLYDRDGDEILILSPNDARAREMEFSPDGARLFTGFMGKAPLVWDVSREGM